MATLKPEIKVYTTKTCPYCVDAKDYLKRKKLTYQEILIDSREKVKELMQVSGQSGVPVIVVGKHVVLGFDQEVLDKLLGK